MIDSDQHPDSNWRPLLKLASTDVIISNHTPFQSLRSIIVFVRVRIRADVSDAIVCQFEKVRNCHKFENWTLIY